MINEQLTKAIQALTAENEELKSKVEDLKNIIKLQTKTMETLKSLSSKQIEIIDSESYPLPHHESDLEEKIKKEFDKIADNINNDLNAVVKLSISMSVGNIDVIKHILEEKGIESNLPELLKEYYEHR